MQSHSTREINEDQEIGPVRWAAKPNVQISDLNARAFFARVSYQLFLSRYILSRDISRSVIFIKETLERTRLNVSTSCTTQECSLLREGSSLMREDDLEGQCGKSRAQNR